jgi:hypothetical protein
MQRGCICGWDFVRAFSFFVTIGWMALYFAYLSNYGANSCLSTSPSPSGHSTFPSMRGLLGTRSCLPYKIRLWRHAVSLLHNFKHRQVRTTPGPFATMPLRDGTRVRAAVASLTGTALRAWCRANPHDHVEGDSVEGVVIGHAGAWTQVDFQKCDTALLKKSQHEGERHDNSRRTNHSKSDPSLYRHIR